MNDNDSYERGLAHGAELRRSVVRAANVALLVIVGVAIGAMFVRDRVIQDWERTHCQGTR